MSKQEDKFITVSQHITCSIDKAWELWTDPSHIVNWYAASDDWHTVRAVNDVKKYGRFLFRMEARDGSFGFDLPGEYRKVKIHEKLEFFLDDGRKVIITFSSEKNGTIITEKFEPEHTFSPEQQKEGWQAILNNFKKYAEKTET